MDGGPDGMVRLDMDPTARLLLPDRNGPRDRVPRCPNVSQGGPKNRTSLCRPPRRPPVILARVTTKILNAFFDKN